MALLLALSVLAVGVAPASRVAVGIDQPVTFAVAMLGELAMGMALALAVLLPVTAIAFSARVVDIQSGAAAINIFNPTVRATEAMVGTAMRWAATLCFFAAGLHLLVLRWVLASMRFAPLGSAAQVVSPAAFVDLLGGQFLLGLAVVAPVILGLLGVDAAVAIASRSMPQANIYFVALPLKMGATLLLLAAALRYAPELINRLFVHAFTAISQGAR
jgi:flagellar biosynthesis protein FliR